VINAFVREALAFVPGDTVCQRNFRAALVTGLKRGLGAKPENPDWTVADVVRQAVERAGCQPDYDSRLLALAWPPERPAS
jgi:hypothetical protein